jgi:pre-rRNA-processing protein TSR1
MHFKITRNFENKSAIPSKTRLEIHCGFRRFVIRPTFSVEPSPGQGDKLKFLRFLRHDAAAIASVYCPIVFSPCKILMFQKDTQTE